MDEVVAQSLPPRPKDLVVMSSFKILRRRELIHRDRWAEDQNERDSPKILNDNTRNW